MRAVIHIDVPDWQIGKTVAIYFPDSMQKKGVCELLEKGNREESLDCRKCGYYIREDVPEYCELQHTVKEQEEEIERRKRLCAVLFNRCYTTNRGEMCNYCGRRKECEQERTVG